MIYRNSYFNKEARQAYIDNTIGFRRKIALALFTGLVSFAVFFVLQTLKESVLSDAVPEIMQPSFFSTLTIYIHVAVLSTMVSFIVYNEWLFFSEIRRNAWYVLIQTGYRPAVMIGGKIAALLYSAFIVYTVGFAFTVLLTVFLKYSFVFAYLPALYLAGLADIALLTALSAVISVFMKSTDDARLMIFAAAVLVFVFKALTGVYDVLHNRVTMQDLSNLWGRSPYFPAVAVLLIVCVAVVIARARRLAQYYTPVAPDPDALPDDVSVVRVDETGRQRPLKKPTRYDRKLINTAVTVLLVVFILAALALNVLIILIGTATPGNEVTIRGTIPYVFASDTMQPAIMVNDLVFFRKIDAQYPIAQGEIVLFKDNNIVYVERVTRLLPDGLEVDIDHYPSSAEVGAMVKQIPRPAVYGVYQGRSRWLGALILFANTLMGRVLFLLVPAVLLFYRKRIGMLYQKRKVS